MTPADYPLSEPGPYQVGVLPLATKDPTRGNRPVDITYRRQQTDEVGHAVLGSITKFSFKRRRRAFLIPLVVLVLGILLALLGPLPGLGMVHMVRQEKSGVADRPPEPTGNHPMSESAPTHDRRSIGAFILFTMIIAAVSNFRNVVNNYRAVTRWTLGVAVGAQTAAGHGQDSLPATNSGGLPPTAF